MLYVSFVYTTIPSVHICPASGGLPAVRVQVCANQRNAVSTLQETVVSAPAQPSQRQPYSGPGLRANIATTRVPAKKSSSPRASSGRQRYFKGLPTGVAACHRAQWPPRVPAHRGSWPHCPDQGHSKFISQTPLGPCSPFPDTRSHLGGKVPAKVRPGQALHGSQSSPPLCTQPWQLCTDLPLLY